MGQTEADIQLLATDLDGTLIGNASDIPLYGAFSQTLEELRALHNTVWAACTGRTYKSFQDFFTPMRMQDLLPDYVVLRHSYIYRLTDFGYIPHTFWNLRTLYRSWREGISLGNKIHEWHNLVRATSQGVKTIRQEPDRLCLRFDSDESARVAAELLKGRTEPFRHLQVFTYMREVDVRTVPFTKGLALSELARRLKIDPENILAIGNGHNDLSMLGGDVAGMTGCPSNSEPEVVETVHNAGGHLAKGKSLGGVIEIVDAYRTGNIQSDFPEGWVPRSQEKGSSTKRRRQKTRYNRRRPVVRPLIVIGLVYTALLAFASFDLLPFSRIIVKPYEWVIGWIQRMLGFL